MVVDLINISYEDIEISVSKCMEETKTLILYLQNNGDRNHVWCNDKFSSVIYEEIDD